VSEPFIGEIKIMANNFPPRGYAVCAGQLLSIAQNTALFSILGTYYGGDGRTTFGLPNLQGNVPLMVGQGPGLSPYTLGETGGAPGIMLTSDELPSHTHTVSASAEQGAFPIPGPDRLFAQSKNGNAYQSTTSQSLTPLAQQAITRTGNSAPHNNMQPYVALNIVIALEGIYPARPF
jgi:microcystin-dependent protein